MTDGICTSRLYTFVVVAILAGLLAIAASSPASAAAGGNLSPSVQHVNCGTHALTAPEGKPCGSVTFNNTSAGPVVVSRVAVDGDTADFGVNGVGFSIPCGPGRVIPAGESCGLNVGFFPTQAGRRSAKLLVSDDASDSAARVGLAGRAIG
jgi:hypothetical protein